MQLSQFVVHLVRLQILERSCVDDALVLIHGWLKNPVPCQNKLDSRLARGQTLKAIRIKTFFKKGIQNVDVVSVIVFALSAVFVNLVQFGMQALEHLDSFLLICAFYGDLVQPKRH